VDQAAARLKTQRICYSLFKEAWEGSSSQVLAPVIKLAEETESYEKLVDEVAKELFPKSRYVEELEEAIFISTRQRSAREARLAMQLASQRYLRLCDRWNRDPTISDIKYINVCLKAMPKPVEDEIRLEKEQYGDLDALFARALEVEEELKRQGKSVMVTTVPEQEEATIVLPATTTERSKVRKCYICGSTEHLKRECTIQRPRCSNCGRTGHISIGCRSQVERDEQGRIKHVVTPSRGSVTTQVRVDGTVPERVTSAKQVLDEILALARDKAAKAKELRQTKQGENVTKRVRMDEELTVMVAQAEEEDLIEAIELLTASDNDQ